MQFNYWLTGTGWADATISHDDQSVHLTASYLGDAMRDLLQAVADLLAGAEAARCSWAEEPGEYRWVFHQSDGVVGVQILWFGDNQEGEPDESGINKFATSLPLIDLATAIAEGASKVLTKYGSEGYFQQWARAPFPETLLSTVQARLSPKS